MCTAQHQKALDIPYTMTSRKAQIQDINLNAITINELELSKGMELICFCACPPTTVCYKKKKQNEMAGKFTSIDALQWCIAGCNSPIIQNACAIQSSACKYYIIYGHAIQYQFIVVTIGIVKLHLCWLDED